MKPSGRARGLPFLLLAVAAFAAGWLASGRRANGERPASPETKGALPEVPAAALPAAARPGLAENAKLSEVAERAVRSVVNVSSIKVIRFRDPLTPFFNDPFFRHFFGGDFPDHFGVPRERRERSLGSGVVVSREGHVLTNNHVVEGAAEISAVLPDGSEIPGRIVGADPKTDVALLQLDAAKELTPIPMGDSDKLRLAEVVLAIGSPFGLQQTVTLGIVSAKGRANVGIADYEDFIQTDAAINPGNSGGALVNLEGQLVGINTAIWSRSGGYQGIGFAIPVNMARFVMGELIKHGRVERGWLGVGFQDVTPELARAFGLEAPSGAVVASVSGGSPAARAGVRQGDVILEIDGKAVLSAAHFRNLLAELPAGREVRLTVLRDRKRFALNVTIERPPVPAGPGRRRRG